MMCTSICWSQHDYGRYSNNNTALLISSAINNHNYDKSFFTRSWQCFCCKSTLTPPPPIKINYSWGWGFARGIPVLSFFTIIVLCMEYVNCFIKTNSLIVPWVLTYLTGGELADTEALVSGRSTESIREVYFKQYLPVSNKVWIKFITDEAYMSWQSMSSNLVEYIHISWDTPPPPQVARKDYASRYELQECR